MQVLRLQGLPSLSQQEADDRKFGGAYTHTHIRRIIHACDELRISELDLSTKSRDYLTQRKWRRRKERPFSIGLRMRCDRSGNNNPGER